jgi:hypothetical protein
MKNETSPPPLFALREMTTFAAIQHQTVRTAALSPFKLATAAFSGVTLAAVGFIEWELSFRLFDAVSGGGQYWSPTLMAFTSLGMLTGYHLAADEHPNHPMVRVMDRVAMVLAPIYAIGTGLMLAMILYGDQISELVAPAKATVFGGDLPDTPPDGLNGWLDTLVTRFGNPVSVLLFTLGVGGLAVCNLAVSHRLINDIKDNVRTAWSAISRAKQAVADFKIVRDAQKRDAQLAQEQEALEVQYADEPLRRHLTGVVLRLIRHALMPHKRWVQQRALQPKSEFAITDGINESDIAERIKAIEAIGWLDIFNAFSPQQPQSTKRKSS